MKQRLIEVIRTVSKLIPGILFPRIIYRDVISIFYHAVSDDVMAHVRHLYPVVPVAAFRETLIFMKEHHNFISYEQLQAHYDNGTELPPNSVHLSFDDGFSECYAIVRPILLELGVPCTFFVTTDWLDNRILYFRHQISLCVHYAEKLPAVEQENFLQVLNQEFDLNLLEIYDFTQWITGFRTPQDGVISDVCKYLGIDVSAYLKVNQPYLTSNQIRELQRDGFKIGAHGLTHRKLGFVPEADIEIEIAGSCAAIQEITKDSVVPFSFPQSAGNVNRRILSELLKRYAHIGLMFDTKDLRQDERFLVNRVWAERPLTPDRVLHPIQEVLENAYRDAWVEMILERLRSI